MKFRNAIIAIAMISNANSWAAPNDAAIEKSLQQIQARSDLVDVSHFEGVVLDLRYATENNFLKRNLYGPLKTCYLQTLAADKLKAAVANLHAKSPGYKLILFDCLRPRSVQRILWAGVVGTPQQKFVGNPDKGSIHNYGFAVDLSVVDENGRELDMGTGFDSFEAKAEPQLEAKHLASGDLTRQQIMNRMILRIAMTQAGFIQLQDEWWHYDALKGSDVRKSYQIVE